eukprot:gb/GEZN01003506.1/.p1 GENE.gb/GEZN01003506.1/~~gb/GEZN01003506.1/.p1  ORF type:complete len:481 (+),score=33.10 gb/GEZN01003506.1/:58-1500(+)
MKHFRTSDSSPTHCLKTDILSPQGLLLPEELGDLSECESEKRSEDSSPTRLVVTKLKYPDRSSYSGEVCSKTKLRHGRGIFLSVRGDRFEGFWQRDRRHGKGCYAWKSGEKYTGEWKKGRMHGEGSFHWNNKDLYVGSWVAGRMTGHGTKIMANKDKYVGEWLNDKANGHGVKTFACGDKHEGEYKNDKRHGYGKYIWKSGDVYKGYWSDGRMHGRGLKIMANGDTYNGEWFKDQAHGYGIKTFVGGDRHEGTYANDKRHGYGTYSWTGGDYFQGTWINGELNGKGTYYYKNGDVFQGIWFQGQKHGVGIFTNGNMSWREDWKHGVQIARTPCRFTPSRLLRTLKPETERARLSQEALRLRIEIDRLKCRLVLVETRGMDPSLHIDSLTRSNGPIPPSTGDTSEPMAIDDDSEGCKSTLEIVHDSALSDDDTCKVCYENRINSVLLRCGHIVVCMKCSAKLEKCPACRATIDEVIQTYRL